MIAAWTGYSNGTIGTANHDWINSGGQCKEGLKMTFVIGEVSTVVLDDTVIDNNNIMTSHPIQGLLKKNSNVIILYNTLDKTSHQINE